MGGLRTLFGFNCQNQDKQTKPMPIDKVGNRQTPSWQSYKNKDKQTIRNQKNGQTEK